MAEPIPPSHILTVNGGSSSIKFAIFEPGEEPRRLLEGAIERVGDAAQAIAGLIDWLNEHGELDALTVVCHRVVHGGPHHFDPVVVTPEVLADLRNAIPLDPNHLPLEIRLIEALHERLPGVRQVACFDTAFHRDLPLPARVLPIPRRYADAGVRRYGFHGLSFTYLLEELERQAGSDAARGRVVLAHLGSGASLAAVRGGRCLDTTMGLTPTGGLMMGTRTGDLDPGVLLYLARRDGLSLDRIEDLIARRSGLLGISETSPDIRDLLAKQNTDSRAAEAIEMFCYHTRKWIGAMTAILGGLDTLVFSGGIGEHAPEIRSRICMGLEFLGLRIDAAANERNEPVISSTGSTVTVRVIPTDEQLMMARMIHRMTIASDGARA